MSGGQAYAGMAVLRILLFEEMKGGRFHDIRPLFMRELEGKQEKQEVFDLVRTREE